MRQCQSVKKELVKRCFLFFAAVLVTHVSLGPEPADTIYFNGIILTSNDEQPTAQAVAVKNGKILAVGSVAEVIKTTGERTFAPSPLESRHP